MKRTLSRAEADELRDLLQVAVVDALIASRRWERGTLFFQGGTALHLAHGSPRYSEDLDFLLAASVDPVDLADRVRERLDGVRWLPTDGALTVTKAKDGRNPHAFTVSIAGARLVGSVRVKVELWRAPDDAMAALQMRVMPMRDRSGLQALAPTLTLDEILADKVFALGARPYLKPRDVYDLAWLFERGAADCTTDDLMRRCAIYPNTPIDTWIESATRRRTELADASERVAQDLQRWLPAASVPTAGEVDRMLEIAAGALNQAITQLRALALRPTSPGMR